MARSGELRCPILAPRTKPSATGLRGSCGYFSPTWPTRAPPRAGRHRKWEEDLRAKGKDPARNAYHEPEPPAPGESPKLPDEWAWVTLNLIAEIRNGDTKGCDLSHFETIEVPYLRVANVQRGYLDLTEVKTIKINATELEKFRLQPNDILFTEGGDRDKLGRDTVWHSEIEDCICQNHIHCARLYSTDLIPEWISLASQLPYARDFFWSVASKTVNLASLNSTNIKSLPIHLPPVAAQRRIVAKIESLFTQAEAIEQEASLAKRRVSQIDKSILARAFRGELVR